MPKLASTSIKRNTLINFVGSFIPIFVSLVTVPLYLHLIGPARYGVLGVVWTLLGYFSLFDMGLGRAIANQVAKLRDGPAHEIETAFWTALLVNAGFGVLGGGIMLFIGHLLLGSLFKMPLELQPEIPSALLWMAISVPIITISSVLTGALEGQERFLIVNIFGVMTALLFQALPVVVAVWNGPNLAGLIGCVVLLRLGGAVLALLACAKYLPLTNWPRFEIKRVVPLCRYGGWVTLAGLINPYLLRLDQFVIGTGAGVQSLPAYNVPYNLVIHVLMLPVSLSRSLFPRFSMLKSDEVRSVGREACLGLAVFITPIIVLGIVLLKPFFELWIGLSLADIAAPIGQTLLLGIWFNSLAIVPYTLLQGQGRADLTAKFHMVEMIPYVLMLWLGMSTAGIQGVAWAWTLRVVVDTALLFGAARIPLKPLVSLVPAAMLVLLASLSSMMLFLNPVWHILIGGSLVMMSLVWAWHIAPHHLKLSLQQLPRMVRELTVRV